MESRSIILMDNSPLVRSMLRRVIERAPGLEIAAEVEELSDYPAIVRETRADWTILLLDPENEVPRIVEQVLIKQPSMRLLLMSVDGSQVRMRWNEPHELPLNDSNLEELLAILREGKPGKVVVT